MGKTAPLKHNPLVNPRSRASKRETSPSINLDKSLKDVSPPLPISSSAISSTLLGPRPNAGISKRKVGGEGGGRGKSQKKTTKQKQRDAKRQDRAEMVLEKMEVKAGKKMGRVRNIKSRKSGWDVVNGEGREERRKAVFGVLGVLGLDDNNDDDNDAAEGWQDVEEEEGGAMQEVVLDHEHGSNSRNIPVVSTASVFPAAVTNGATASEDMVDEAEKIT